MTTGAAALFGATGGVMEAALRTAYEVMTGEKLPKVELEAVRGYSAVRSVCLVMLSDELLTISLEKQRSRLGIEK